MNLLHRQFVDGWELNGEYFPGVYDHELSLENRVNEFCDKSFSFAKKVNRKRKFISHQNAAVFQYKIPLQGAFAISVKYLHNPKREKYIFIRSIRLFLNLLSSHPKSL